MDSPTGAPVSGKQNLLIPVAIVLAGGLVAAALFFGGGGSGTQPTGTNEPASGSVDKLLAVANGEHIYGNPNAPIKIVEYTDLECPFCKAFHVTMKQIMNEYGASGKVAWVIRNFPLQQLHPNAPKLAEAAECVASVGGNDAYWKFLESVFEQYPINTFFDFAKLDSTVSGIGVDVKKFEECYTSGKFKDKITKEFNDAVASGGQGTPHNILVTSKGEKVPIPGAQPFATVKSVIESALKN
jgi:protein-disulfide isomerase